MKTRVARYTLSYTGHPHSPMDDRVFVAQWDAERGKYRVTVFGIDGPHGHSYMTGHEFDNELKWQRASEDDLASAWLEGWTLTPEWERGLKQCSVLAAWNAASRRGWYDICDVIDIQPTLEAAVAVLPLVRWLIGQRSESSGTAAAGCCAEL